MKLIQNQITYLFLFLLSSTLSIAQWVPDDSKGFVAHDPVMIEEGGTYYLFTTGGGIAKSTDMENWERIESVPSKLDWVTDDIIPGYRGQGYWAPDIQYLDGTYYLYYSPSAFAKNTSAIGVMTNKTLDQSSPDYKWVDHGMIVQSIPGRDFWNAIDANVYFDKKWGGEITGWLSFGSFWGGLKLVKLDSTMKALAEPQEWYTIAKQERTFGMPDTDPGDGTIEAPFIYKRHQYYYLFVSTDYCCRGLDSTYQVVVGRSRDIRGPYFDKEGKPLYAGGGTFVAGETEEYAGIGHCAVYDFDGKTYFVAHGYDKKDEGRSKLVVKPIEWDRAEWPTVKF
ncbi:arabinan endo-1,5-alpha-L-arabinosidase [Flagellimonas sp. GZD32]|uniref:arabinan endo-1,5-alpha-L-arabinosidase n=1 Tax=Flagellimonas cixiensis TaxID=3228750 RepID=UPI0035C8AE04